MLLTIFLMVFWIDLWSKVGMLLLGLLTMVQGSCMAMSVFNSFWSCANKELPL